ncbi:MAG: ATP-binding cassette domain-containing protein [Bacteroidia bacterium]
MNTISLKEISKKFLRQTIFNNISFEAQQGDVIAITGYNGSGKSTLLQIVAGYISPTSGQVDFFFKNKKIHPDNLYQYISLAAPYLELIEEFTLAETISFYTNFKSLINERSISDEIQKDHTEFSMGKQIKFYSSGMKQRVKLALALMTDVPFVLLDEPHSNLDQKGIIWFNDLLAQNKDDKIIFISSNRVREETGFCNKFINLEDYKKN